MTAEGYFDHSIYDGNEVLNPIQIEIEVGYYVQEYKGRPGLAHNPSIRLLMR